MHQPQPPLVFPPTNRPVTYAFPAQAASSATPSALFFAADQSRSESQPVPEVIPTLLSTTESVPLIVALPIMESSSGSGKPRPTDSTIAARKPRTKTIECKRCHKLHDRHRRAEACENKDNGLLGYPCGGRGPCRDQHWYVLDTSAIVMEKGADVSAIHCSFREVIKHLRRQTAFIVIVYHRRKSVLTGK